MSRHTTSKPRPLVSIGLPVFNGANYLRDAADAILRQTYPAIELIISDNASTDETSAICDELQRRDQRVRVSRNIRNVGAAGNYNKVFHAARGEYFKWAAHDDVLAPTFIERAVETLTSDSTLVLCSARTGRINDRGEVTGTYASNAAWASCAAPERFRSLVCEAHACVAVFGVIRRDVLARTPLIAPYVNSDRVLLAELGLHGRLHELQEDLFFRRDHEGSSLRAFPDHRQRVVWFDPSKKSHLSFPEWNELLGYASAVRRAGLPVSDSLPCWMTVVRLASARWRPLLADFKYAAVGAISARRV